MTARETLIDKAFLLIGTVAMIGCFFMAVVS